MRVHFMPHLAERFAGQVYVCLLILGLLVFGGWPACRWVLGKVLDLITPPVKPIQPAQPPPPAGVYRVPSWAARTPQTLRQHPCLAEIDDHLDQLATYYPTAERSNR
jgi:hypothetical protein